MTDSAAEMLRAIILSVLMIGSLVTLGGGAFAGAALADGTVDAEIQQSADQINQKKSTTFTQQNEASEPTTIENCAVIDESGRYELTRDLVAENDCIEITTDNVVLDGNLNVITGAEGGDGIYVGSHTNVTIRNIVVEDWTRGIVFNGTADSTLSTVESRANRAAGIVLLDASGNVIENGTIRQNEAADNRIDSSGVGVRLRDASNNNSIINTASVGNEIGFATGGSNNRFKRVTARDNAQGFINTGFRVSVTNSSSINNTDSAVRITEQSAEAEFENFETGPSPTETTTVSFEGEQIILRSVEDPPEPPDAPGTGRYFELTSSSPLSSGAADIELHYEEGDLTGVNETDLRLWEYDERWEPRFSTVDTTENRIEASLTVESDRPPIIFGAESGAQTTSTDASTFGAFEGPDSALFTISSVETNAPVAVGDTLTVTVELMNLGTESGTERLDLSTSDQTVLASHNITLEGGERRNVTLQYQPAENDTSLEEVVVSSEEPSSASPVTITEGIAPLPNEYETILSGLAGDGSAETPYIITNVTELQAIGGDLDAHYELSGDINAAETDEWYNGTGFVPLGQCDSTRVAERVICQEEPFTGSLDGNGHTISGLRINRERRTVGLFGYVNGGTIEQVEIAESDITTSGSTSAGGLVGTNSGTIEDSRVRDVVLNSEEEFAPVGGLVGTNEVGGVVRSSTANDNVTSIGRRGFVGGLIGTNRGTVERSSASLTLTITDGYLRSGGLLVGENWEGGEVSNSGANGTLLTEELSQGGSARAGGLTGSNSGRIYASTATVNISTKFLGYVGGFVGRNSDTGTVTRSNVNGAVSADRNLATGGFVGENDGAIRASTTGADVDDGRNNRGGFGGTNEGTIERSIAGGNVTGEERIGGFVGFNDEGTISLAAATGTVTGDTDVGGLVGSNSGGTITNTYARGSVSANGTAGGLVGLNAGNVTFAYATGTVEGDEAVGGLIGQNGDDAVYSDGRDGALEDAYWDIVASNQSVPIGKESGDSDDSLEPGASIVRGEVTGLSTAALTGDAVVENTTLDFEATWRTTKGYPTLANLPIEETTTDSPVNQRASSVTPDTVRGGEEQTFEVTVQVESMAIADDDSGEIDVVFENFQVDRRTNASTVESGVTIPYTAANSTDGTLTVSTAVTATSPPIAGEVTAPVFVSNLRRTTDSGASEFLLEGRREVIDTVTIEDTFGREQLNLTANTTSVEQGGSVQFTVTDNSGTPVDAVVRVPGSETELRTGEDGTVSTTVRTVGKVEVIATEAAQGDGADNGTDSGFAPGFAQLNVQSPSVAVNASQIEFGDVPPGSIVTETVNVTSNASVPVEVEPFIDGPQARAFGIDNAPDAIPAGGNATVTVGFAALDPVTANGVLVIGDNRIPLTGTGAAPDIRFQTEIPVEITSDGGAQNATVTVENTGNADLNAVLRNRSTVGDAAFDHPDTLNVSSGSSETFKIRFNGGSIESREAFAEILVEPDGDTTPPRIIPVAGVVREPEIDIRRETITFGASGPTVVNQPEERAVVVKNTGSTTETLTASTNNQNFTVIGPSSSFTLDPGEAQRMIVEVNASSVGTLSGVLTVKNTTDASVSDTAELSATVAEPKLDIAESVAFSETPVNSGTTEEFQISNTGSASLRASLSVTDRNFTVLGDTDVVVAPDGTETVRIGFAPETIGSTSATLSVETNDPDATETDETVALNGTGIDANVSADRTTMTFGSVGLADSTTETLTLTNGGSEVEVTDVTVSGAAGFSEQSDVEGQTVGNGDELEIDVVFEPEATGAQTGALSLTAETTAGEETPTRTFSTNLLGTGQDSELRIARQRLRTGVTVADGTTTGRISIENTGPAGTELTIDSVTVTDTENFTVTDSGSSVSVGDVLSSNEAGQIALTFAPETGVSDGEQTAELVVNASGGERTFNRTIPVSGIVSAPAPTASTTSIDAGTVGVGEPIRETVTLSNEGGEPYTVSVDTDTAQVVGPSKVFPGGETTVAINTTSSEAGQFAETITINQTADAAALDSTDVTVSGDAVAPELTVEPTTVSFSDTATSSASSREVRLRNTGNAALELAPPELMGADSVSVISGDQTLRIGPGNSQNITLGFEPDTAGRATATLTLDPRVPTKSTQSVDIQGTGVTAEAGLNDSAIGFGELKFNETQTRTLELSNDGSAPLEVTGTSITGSNSVAFSVTGLSRPVLDAGESRTFEVEVNTTGVSRGPLTAEVAISTNESTVTAFTGATVSEPNIDVQRAVQAGTFGTTRLGTASTATVEVNNTGTGELSLDNLTVAGEDPAAFTVVEAPANDTIPAADSGEVVIEFDPAAVSNAVTRAQGTPLAASGELIIGNTDPDAGDGNVTVDLSGEGETPAFDVQRTLQFGDTPIGEVTTANLTIENTASGTAPLNVTVLEVSGQNAGEYNTSLASDTAPVSLSPGESTTVEVGLEPASLGQKFGTLSVQTNDTRQPVAKVGLSNTETIYKVNYGSVNVTYFNPSSGPEPTVNVDDGLQGRNATLRAVNSDVNTTDNYALNYTFATPGEVETNALNRSTGTALRYVEATTTADSELNESTIQMTVSKAALAAQETSPENVTIYHDGNDNGTYEGLETELLFETPQGYVYEATTESYSTLVIAGDAPTLGEEPTETEPEPDPEPEPEPEPDPEPDNPDGDGSDTPTTSGGGGGGGSVSWPPGEDSETTEEPEGDDGEQPETEPAEESGQTDEEQSETDSSEKPDEDDSESSESDGESEQFEADTTQQPEEQPGLGIGPAIVALLGATLLAKRRQMNS